MNYVVLKEKQDVTLFTTFSQYGYQNNPKYYTSVTLGFLLISN